MPDAPLRWLFSLDVDAQGDTPPPALVSFLQRADITWLPSVGARRELGLPTVVVVLSTAAGPRVLAVSPSEAEQLVPGVDVLEAPPAGAVWCAALLPGASGRWVLRSATSPQRGPRLEIVRGEG